MSSRWICCERAVPLPQKKPPGTTPGGFGSERVRAMNSRVDYFDTWTFGSIVELRVDTGRNSDGNLSTFLSSDEVAGAV